MLMRERFENKVDRTGGPNACHIWTGARHPLGHGHFRLQGKTAGAHRVAWAMANKRPVPEGLEIDHLCRNPPCVNPVHLEAVTRREHVHRSFSPSSINARKTHCNHGHALSGDNLRIDPKSGQRTCKACNRTAVHRYDERQRAISR